MSILLIASFAWSNSCWRHWTHGVSLSTGRLASFQAEMEALKAPFTTHLDYIAKFLQQQQKKETKKKPSFGILLNRTKNQNQTKQNKSQQQQNQTNASPWCPLLVSNPFISADAKIEVQVWVQFGETRIPESLCPWVPCCVNRWQLCHALREEMKADYANELPSWQFPILCIDCSPVLPTLSRAPCSESRDSKLCFFLASWHCASVIMFTSIGFLISSWGKVLWNNPFLHDGYVFLSFANK